MNFIRSFTNNSPYLLSFFKERLFIGEIYRNVFSTIKVIFEFAEFPASPLAAFKYSGNRSIKQITCAYNSLPIIFESQSHDNRSNF